MSLVDIKSLYLEEIENDFKALSIPKYRAKQVFSWLAKGVETFDDMTDLSIDLRNSLKERYYISSVEIEKKLESKHDGTIKYLFKLQITGRRNNAIKILFR